MNQENILACNKRHAVPQHRNTHRPFLCFRTGEIFLYLSETTQFDTFDAKSGVTRQWELITPELISKVRSIIVKSLPAPKSVDMLLQTIDLYYRALHLHLARGGDIPEGVPADEAATVAADPVWRDCALTDHRHAGDACYSSWGMTEPETGAVEWKYRVGLLAHKAKVVALDE